MAYKGQFGYYDDSQFSALNSSAVGYGDIYYCMHRYYDANIGRWISRDPSGLDGGVNTYAYCDGNPVTGADPSGLDSGSEEKWFLIIKGDRTSSEPLARMFVGGEFYANSYTVTYLNKHWSVKILENPSLKEAKEWLGKADGLFVWAHGWGGLIQLNESEYLTADDCAEVALARFRAGKRPMAVATLDACDSLASNPENQWSGIASIVRGYRGEMSLNWKLVNGDSEVSVHTLPFSPPVVRPRKRRAARWPISWNGGWLRF